MNNDFTQALQLNRIGFLWIDHQSDFGDYDDVRFERYTRALAQFKQDVGRNYQAPCVTVLYIRDTSLHDDNGLYHKWYDNKKMLIQNEAALEQLLTLEDTDILHPFDVSEPLCLKRHSSCFKDPYLGDYLRENSVSHVLLAGAYLNACVEKSAFDALHEDFVVGIVHDATYTNQDMSYYDQKHDYAAYIRRTFENEVMVTDRAQVLCALKIPNF